MVINYDVPTHPSSWSESAKAYVHRVGRTARAGRPGRAVTLVTPYSATRLKIIEAALGSQIPQLDWVDPSKADPQLLTTIDQAATHAKTVSAQHCLYTFPYSTATFLRLVCSCPTVTFTTSLRNWSMCVVTCSVFITFERREPIFDVWRGTVTPCLLTAQV